MEAFDLELSKGFGYNHGILNDWPDNGGQVDIVAREVMGEPQKPKPKPRKGKSINILISNRLAQSKYREKKRKEGAAIEELLEKLQTQLAVATEDAKNQKNVNVALSKAVELRSWQIDLLAQARNWERQGDGASPSGASDTPGPAEDVAALMSLCPVDAVQRWRVFIQQMATLLVPVEVPDPESADVEQLKDVAGQAAAFLRAVVTMNATTTRTLLNTNMTTMQLDYTTGYSEEFWVPKVASLLLTSDQAERILFLTRRVEATIAPHSAQRQLLDQELKVLLPQTFGQMPLNMDARMRSEEALNHIRRGIQASHDAMGGYSATVLGKLLTPLQFARLAVASYPFLPRAYMVARCVARADFVRQGSDNSDDPSSFAL